MAPLKILLVEDEEHKILDLSKRISERKDTSTQLRIASSVRDAINAVVEMNFDLIILDMALPTFTREKSSGETGGVAQASGGIEVIRMLQQQKASSKIVIVSQYPDIYISGELIKSRRIKDTLRKKYGCDVIGVVDYNYNSQEWIKPFDRFLERLP